MLAEPVREEDEIVDEIVEGSAEEEGDSAELSWGGESIGSSASLGGVGMKTWGPSCPLPRTTDDGN